MEDEPITVGDESIQHTSPTSTADDPIVHDAEDLDDDKFDDEFAGGDGDQGGDSPDDAKSDDEQPDEEEARKEQAREAYERRQTAKREAEQRNQAFLADLRQQAMSRVAQPDEAHYEDIAEDQGQNAADMQRRLDAIEQREQQQQIDAAVQRIESQRNFIGMNIAQAESKIPLFNKEDTEHYNEQLHEAVLADWAASSLETATDANGEVHVLGLKDGAQSPEEYMQEKAQLYGNILQHQSAKAQADAQRNRKSGESPSSAKATAGKVDASLRAFDEAFDSY